MKNICFYKRNNGKIPVKIFFDELKFKYKKILAKIFVKLDRLKSGEDMCTDDIKHIFKKVYELRVKQSSNITRTFYLIYEKDKIVLLDGIIKKTNKIHARDLNRIKLYYKDFLDNGLYEN